MSPVEMLGEESLVSMKDRTIAGAGRNFAVVCAVHGMAKKQRQKMGHHGTLQVSALKKLFPKQVRRQLKRLLNDDEWRLFNESLHGKRWPSDNDVSRWKALLTE
jgi:hypothetical protein